MINKHRLSSVKHSASVIFCFAVITSCGGGGSAPATTPPPPNPPPVTMPPMSDGPSDSELLRDALTGLALDEFFDASFKALGERTPESVIALGLDSAGVTPSVKLNNISETYQNETFAIVNVILELLRTYDRSSLTTEQQLNFDVYEWYLQDESDRQPFMFNNFIATYFFFSVHRSTERFFTETHPRGTEQDAIDYIERMNQVGRKIDQAIDLLITQEQRRIIEPFDSLSIASNQISLLSIAVSGGHPYFEGFNNVLDAAVGLSVERKDQLRTQALESITQVVKPAHARLHGKVSEQLIRAPQNIGVGQYPNGPEYYQWALKHHSTTDLTPQEIHDLGIDELQRIRNEMRLIFDELGYSQDASLSNIFIQVANDGGIVPAAEVQARYESLVEFARQQLDQAFDVFPTVDVVIESDSSGGYYIRPSLDGSRPGAFYAGTTQRPYYDMPTLTFHEALPGHHTQIALALEQDIPLFRQVLTFTGFVEGWALYAERLAYELGWYDNDVYGNLGRLQFEALRAARLVMDTGIHDLGWSLDEARQFNQDNVGWSFGASQGAALRYSVYTGQATAYYVGMLKILEQRQRAMDELGVLFDLKAFHRTLLTNGAVPLTLLDSVVDRYIAETQAAN